MLSKKNKHPLVKEELHPRNKHRERYNFEELTKACPELSYFVKPNKFHDLSIDFSKQEAVKTLNRALLKHFYDIDYWDIPRGYLTPPIPGRADYIHYAADLLAGSRKGKIPTGRKIRCLDIGVGANCIYPIIGGVEYAWSFVGTDVEPASLKSAQKIIDGNPSLKGKIELRLQGKTGNIFKGIIGKGEKFDITICNPPFHSSLEDANAGTLRKLRNLNKKKVDKAKLNFGGQSNELLCEGGEKVFVKKMILQSKEFSASCKWFTTLVSKESNLKSFYKLLESVNAKEVKTIAMGQGNKKSRILAWKFRVE
jgi:23S rRNA (adenine1618-N6)-methyltransferase